MIRIKETLYQDKKVKTVVHLLILITNFYQSNLFIGEYIFQIFFRIELDWFERQKVVVITSQSTSYRLVLSKLLL